MFKLVLYSELSYSPATHQQVSTPVNLIIDLGNITGNSIPKIPDIDSLASPHKRNPILRISQIYLNNTPNGSVQGIVEIFSMSVTAAFFIPRPFTPSYQFHSFVTFDLA